METTDGRPLHDRGRHRVFLIRPAPVYPGLQTDPGAAALSFTWDTTAATWLLRVPLDTLAPQKSLLWQKVGTILTAYVYNDGEQPVPVRDRGQRRYLPGGKVAEPQSEPLVSSQLGGMEVA